MRWARLVLLAVLLATQAWADAGAVSISAPLRALLAKGDWGTTPAPFRIVTLSFVADGCAAEARLDPRKHDAARACVAQCLALARTMGHERLRPETDDGLWLTHDALILGAADELGPCPDPTRHEAIAKVLARRSLADPRGHVASYTRLANRWPADQTATLASLARFDRAHGTRLHEEPLRAFRTYVLGRAMDRRLGLPWSEVTDSDRFAREPRGCALSFQTRYLHEVDVELAAAWWTAYKAHFLTERFGLAGFREWPPGRDRAGDDDSGLIVDGVGAAATGLGIAAARSMGDEDLAARIERTASIVGVVGYALEEARGPLPEAIRYLGKMLRP
jgi:hypothetical protein